MYSWEIVCTITINAIPCTAFSTHIRVTKKDWNSKNQRIKNNDSLNARLQKIKSNLDIIHLDLENKGKTITAQILQDIHLGKTKLNPTLLECYDIYIDHLKDLVKRKKLKQATVDKEGYRYANVKRFLCSIGLGNMTAETFSLRYVLQFESWTASVKLGSNDHSQKHIQALRRVLHLAYKRELISEEKIATHNAASISQKLSFI